MKRIAIFCDGTWNSPNTRYQTNVSWLSECVVPGDGQTQQIHKYFDGVGVRTNPITGGVIGEGLDLKVLEAYRWLCGQYQLGDEIYVFGFSRGAYTARSLVGLMRSCGVLTADSIDHVDEAMEIYRQRGRTPDTKRAEEFRSKYAAASVDPEHRRMRGYDAEAASVPGGRMLRVRYLGIWDTVGALGIPETIPGAALINPYYRFHDCDLSRHVEYARHAVAIDEYRKAFAPTLWTLSSMRDINDMHGETRVRQVWFPGDHGSVGGGGKFPQLSNAALLWVAEGAEQAGLRLDRGHASRLTQAAAALDPVEGPLHNNPDENVLLKLTGEGARENGPVYPVEVSGGGQNRMRRNPSYLTLAQQQQQEDKNRCRWRRTTLSSVMRALRIP